MSKGLSEARLNFLRMHLRAGLAKNGRLTKYAGHKTFIFVAACRDAGIIEIIDPDKLFPYSWQATQITPTGRAVLASPVKGE